MPAKDPTSDPGTAAFTSKRRPIEVSVLKESRNSNMDYTSIYKLSMSEQAESPFFRLPGELRNRVYALVLEGVEDSSAPVDLLDTAPPSQSLVATCRSARKEAKGLYNEAYHKYWGETKFILDADFNTGTTLSKSEQSRLLGLQHEALGENTSLTLRITCASLSRSGETVPDGIFRFKLFKTSSSQGTWELDMLDRRPTFLLRPFLMPLIQTIEDTRADSVRDIPSADSRRTKHHLILLLHELDKQMN